jgi:hypothetical protein
MVSENAALSYMDAKWRVIHAEELDGRRKGANELKSWGRRPGVSTVYAAWVSAATRWSWRSGVIRMTFQASPRRWSIDMSKPDGSISHRRRP